MARSVDAHKARAPRAWACPSHSPVEDPCEAGAHALETLEPRLLLNSGGPDLTGTLDQARLGRAVVTGQVLVPGDKLSLTATVFNQGDQAAAGPLDFDLYASPDQSLDPEDDRLLLAQHWDRAELAAGERYTARTRISLPGDLESGDYYLIGRLGPTGPLGDVDPANDVMVSAHPVSVRWGFGTVDGRSVKLRVQDGDGTGATFSLKGGSGRLQRDGSGALCLSAAGTAKSSLKVKTDGGGDGVFQLEDVIVNSSVSSIDLRGVEIGGGLNVAGGVKRLVLGDMAPGTAPSVVIGATDGVGPASIAMGSVRDVTQFRSQTPIRSLKLTEWLDEDGVPDVLQAPAIGKVMVVGNRRAGISGDFEAGLVLTGSPSVQRTLGRAKVPGSLRGGQWTVTGDAGAISAGAIDGDWSADVTGALSGLGVKGDVSGRLAAGPIGKLGIGGSLRSAVILSGADLGGGVAAAGATDNADGIGPGRIGKVTIKGGASSSVIAAGLDTVDGVINNGDDVIVGGADSAIGKFSIAGEADGECFFGAGTLPRTVKIDGVTIDPARDRRFLLASPVTTGAFRNVGGYAAPKLISFVDAVGISREVLACPGQVQVFAGSGVSPETVEGLVAAGGGTIISQIPYLDYYLAAVADGCEDDFIAGALASGDVVAAMPNLLLHRGYIDLDTITGYPEGDLPMVLDFPSSVAADTHLYVMDDFVRADMPAGDPATHGDTVAYVATQGLSAAGAQINMATDDSGTVYLTTDVWMAALAVAAQDMGYYPTGNVIINVSFEGSPRDEAGNLLPDEQYKSSVGALLRQYAQALEKVGEEDPELLERMAIVTIAGNGNPGGVDLADVINSLRKDFPRVFPLGPSGGGDHLIIVGGTKPGSDQADTSSFNYSSHAGDVIYAPAHDVKVDDGGGTLTGTSFAAPAVTNLLEQALIANPTLTLGQVTAALKQLVLRLGRVPSVGEITGELHVEPAVSVSDAGVLEGDAGTAAMVFTVTLSRAAAQAVKVSYHALGGSAAAGKDFKTAKGSLTFSPGQTSRTVTVAVIGDQTQEENETVFLGLTGTDGAIIADGLGEGTIVDDDLAGVTVSPTSGLHTSEDGGTATFSVVLQTKPAANVVIPLSSSDTTEGIVPKSSLTFTPRNWSRPQQVTVKGAGDDEPDGAVGYSILVGPASSADPFYAGLDPADVSVVNDAAAVRWSVSATVHTAGYTRTYAGTVAIPPDGGSASFSSGGATLTVTVAGSWMTLSGSGFGAAAGASAHGTASGSGLIAQTQTGASAGGALDGTLQVVYEDGSEEFYPITGSFTATAS